MKYSRSVERVEVEDAGKAEEEEVKEKGEGGGSSARSIVFGGREGKEAGYSTDVVEFVLLLAQSLCREIRGRI